ncbi:MAG: Holliday junction branch migration DNA helicase RuvB [Candidatus Kerfeldbacteria bacterium]|nr:Holliday junction branch migration DNA helicase RuvB [Candidatus Kerfeldbacteria bacterium]
MADERVIAEEAGSEDQTIDLTLRPRRLSEYVGQEAIKQNLKIALAAAKQRRESIEHILLHGNPGLGKTTLAYVIAHELGAGIRVTSGPAIERAGDLAAILTSLADGDILFIDEMHRLNRTIEEVLYPAMEDFKLDLVVGKGPGARTIRLDLPKFTLIGATTRMSALSSPLRDRFGLTFRLDYYRPEDVEQIVKRSGSILGVALAPEAAAEIARRSRRTPRVANRLLKRVRDYVAVKAGNGPVSPALAAKALEALAIDTLGLDEIDRRILETIIDKFGGGPVGLGTIAAAVAEETETLEEVYEPFLLQLGFLGRTPRGRVVTAEAYKHLGRRPPATAQPIGI